MSTSEARATTAARERRQIVAGLLDAVAEHGPTRLRERDVVAAAGTGLWTFRAHFDDLDVCFDFACEAALDTLLSPMVASWSVPRPPRERLDAAIGALLDSLAAQPRLAELCLLHSPVRQADRHTYRRAVDALAELLPPGEATLAAGLVGQVAARLAAGRAADLEALRPVVVALLLPALDG